MNTINLTHGKITLVDSEDYQALSQHNWFYHLGYARRQTKRKWVNMHRVVCDAPEGFEVDHINGDKLDNRRENLRICTRKENARNKVKRSTISSSKFKGVTAYKNRWMAQIGVDGQNINLGLFTKEEEAAKAYNKAAINYFGEFARVNKLNEVTV